jgi:AcrR family transcriptional regulator
MEKEKMNWKKLQGAETRRKIIESADSLFREYGFDNVSVDSIVEKAGISKGGFYVHFESKDALTAVLITEYVKRADLSYGAFTETFPEGAETSAILLSLVGKIADMITDRVGYVLIKMAYRIQIDRNISTDALLSYSRDIYRVFGSLIQRGVRRGEFTKELDAETTAEQFVTVLRGFTYEWCIRYPDFHLKEELLRQFQLLLSGLEK